MLVFSINYLNQVSTLNSADRLTLGKQTKRGIYVKPPVNSGMFVYEVRVEIISYFIL